MKMADGNYAHMEINACTVKSFFALHVFDKRKCTRNRQHS